MDFIPKTKAQAAAFAVVMASLGAFVLVIAQAFQMVHCPIAPLP